MTIFSIKINANKYCVFGVEWQLVSPRQKQKNKKKP